ncbi:MAG: 2-hydroxychromene-2-carboxylate isomerase [Casimicrobiaceae bacterium]
MPPTRIADWYFDFISPFAYLQSEQLDRLRPHVQLRYKPVLFAGLLKHWGQKGPAEVVPKKQFTFEFAMWQASRLGIPFKMPPAHPFNPLALLRLATAADARPEIVHAIFRFVWQEGRVPDTPLEWFELTSLLELPNADAEISASRVKDELRASTDAAIERGVFGVPTLIVDDRLFWGLDATDMALDYVQGSPVFRSDAYAKIRGVPDGTGRAD